MAKRKSPKQPENISATPDPIADAKEADTKSPGVEESAQDRLLELAAPLVATIQIRDIYLVDSRVTSQHVPIGPAVKGYLRIRTYDTTYAVIKPEENSGLFWVKVPFSLIAAKRPGQTSGEDLIFEIDASFRIVYQTKQPELLNDTAIDAFAKTNGVFNAWSYWREYAQSTTVRMGFPPVTVPVYRM